MPLLIDNWGIGATLFIAVALAVAGVLVTWTMAPETKDLSLTEAAGAGGTYQRAARRRAPAISGRRTTLAR